MIFLTNWQLYSNKLLYKQCYHQPTNYDGNLSKLILIKFINCTRPRLQQLQLFQRLLPHSELHKQNCKLNSLKSQRHLNCVSCSFHSFIHYCIEFIKTQTPLFCCYCCCCVSALTNKVASHKYLLCISWLELHPRHRIASHLRSNEWFCRSQI